jgi:hypothetical protein
MEVNILYYSILEDIEALYKDVAFQDIQYLFGVGFLCRRMVLQSTLFTRCHPTHVRDDIVVLSDTNYNLLTLPMFSFSTACGGPGAAVAKVLLYDYIVR